MKEIHYSRLFTTYFIYPHINSVWLWYGNKLMVTPFLFLSKHMISYTTFFLNVVLLKTEAANGFIGCSCSCLFTLLHWHQWLFAIFLLWDAWALFFLSKGEFAVCLHQVCGCDGWGPTRPVSYVESDIDIDVGAGGPGADDGRACWLRGLRGNAGLQGSRLCAWKKGHGLCQSRVKVVEG